MNHSNSRLSDGSPADGTNKVLYIFQQHQDQHQHLPPCSRYATPLGLSALLSGRAVPPPPWRWLCTLRPGVDKRTKHTPKRREHHQKTGRYASPVCEINKIERSVHANRPCVE